MRVAATGAYGYSGQYIAQRLLDAGHEVYTLTNSPHRADPFGERVKAFGYNLSKPAELERSLCGVDVLINNYWVRLDKPPQFTFARALANAKVLFDAAKRAGIGRIVHISITNPDRNSGSALLPRQGRNGGLPQVDWAVVRHPPADGAVRQGG